MPLNRTLFRRTLVDGRELRFGVGALWPRRHALFWMLPALFAAAYLIALLANYGSVITSINMDSDAVIAPVIGKLLGQAPAGSHVILGNHPYYEEFLFLRATAALPAYRQLWDVAPMLWTLLAIAILAWSARRALGGFAALLSACALICLGQVGRFWFFTFDAHGLTVLHTVVVGAALVWLAPRATVISWPRMIAAASGLGLFSSLPVASDKLFPFWALAPLLLTSGLMAWRATGRARATIPVFAIVTVFVAVLGGALVAHVMRAEGITATAFPVNFASDAALVGNVVLLFEGYVTLGGGNFLGLPAGGHAWALALNGALILAAIMLVLVEVRRRAESAGPRPTQGSPASSTLAYVGFWASSFVVQSLAFVGSNVPADALSSRYVLAGYFAIGALAPLLALRAPAWRVLVTAGICLFTLSSTYELARRPFDPIYPLPGPTQANQILSFARANGARVGYSGYWDAADLTWLTRFKLKIFPVASACGPYGLCRFPTVQIDTWYRPRPQVRSLLIADPSRPGLARIDPQLGRPVATTKIGNLAIAVYAFDIASKL